MNNKFINNGANLLHTNKNKKTKVESQIAELKQQEQEILKELTSCEIKNKKADKFQNYLSEVERFSTKFLTEAVEKEKNQENSDIYWLENLIKNKVKFAFQFESAFRTFYQLVFQKTENQVRYLKSKLSTIQEQLSHQERIFARIEIRRQGKVLLECKLNNRLGCLDVYRCDSCRINYSANNSQLEVASP